MAFFGISDEISDAPREEDEEVPLFPVWADNWPTLRVFLNLASQWHIVMAPDGEMIRTGIRRDAIEFERKQAPGWLRRKWPEVVRNLRTMEASAILAMREGSAKRRKEAPQRTA